MHRIVILGGGFGGLRTALELEKRCGRFGDCEILLIDRRAEHVYTPLLYEVATGFLQERGSVCRGELQQGVCVSFEEYCSIIGAKHVRFQRAEVTGVNAKEKTVAVKSGQVVAYDQLVIALGSEPAFYGIPGLKEHALVLKNVHDAFLIRERIHEQIEAYRRGDAKAVRLFVGGAGATGVEIACEAAHFFQALESAQVIRRGDWSVTLVDAGAHILMAFPESIRTAAQKRLASLGVTMVTSAKMKRLEEGTIFCDVDGSEKIFSADVILWCGGIQPSSLVQALDLPKGPKGHIDVEETLRVRGTQNIFALGDCAQIASGKGFVPALAQTAVEEARVVAENVCREIAREPLVAWHPPTTWPALLPLGGTFAVGIIGPLSLHGWMAFQLRRLVDLRYWLQTLPLKHALSVWWNGAKTYVKNDAL